MSVNRLEPDLLTIHSKDGGSTLEIGTELEDDNGTVTPTLLFRVTNETGLSTSTEIRGVTTDNVSTIISSLTYWSLTGKLTV